MQDEQSSRPRSRRWIAFVALPVLYVLSYAPALVMLDVLDKRDVLSYESETKLWDVWRTFYAPLGWASDRSQWFNQALKWYVELF